MQSVQIIVSRVLNSDNLPQLHCVAISILILPLLLCQMEALLSLKTSGIISSSYLLLLYVDRFYSDAISCFDLISCWAMLHLSLYNDSYRDEVLTPFNYLLIICNRLWLPHRLLSFVYFVTLLRIWLNQLVAFICLLSVRWQTPRACVLSNIDLFWMNAWCAFNGHHFELIWRFTSQRTLILLMMRKLFLRAVLLAWYLIVDVHIKDHNW